MKKGFTLIEILLVVAIIAILAGIVILAINPGKQLADARNAQRRADVNTILNAVYQYSIDNSGTIPSDIPESSLCSSPNTNEVCETDVLCTDKVVLSELTASKKYIVEIPKDPKGGVGPSGTGYFISKDATNRITVCAPKAEEGETISVTR